MKTVIFMCALAFACATGGVANASYFGNKDKYKCASGTSKGGSKFITLKSKCVTKCESGAQKGKNPFADCDPPYASACAECVGKATTKGHDALVKACTKACPDCYVSCDSAAADGRIANLELQLDAFVPAVACEETSDKGIAKCINGNAKALTKYAAAATKCYAKCYGSVNSGKIANSADCAPPATDATAVACLSKAAGKATDSFTKACPTLPSCYDDAVHAPASIPSPSTGTGWVGLVDLAVNTTVGTNYCGSPSGAFIQ